MFFSISSGKYFHQLVLQAVLLALVVGLHELQTGYLHVQVHTLLDARVPGAQGLDLGKGKRRFIHIITGAHRTFAGHDLADEFLLVLHGLPEIGVEGPLGDIAVHMDERVAVSLALDAAFALGQVPGPPGAVQVVHGDETVLDIGARPHFLCTSHQDAHLAGADLGKQLFLLRLGVRYG